ncbi:MAG: 2-amino-4-hydroxy-6-hydroxymethyldihydropteridine diphosphokinase [Gammaproteobacteria bacterium]|nr:2-amino-4-hydroxy-6-hydroxymethyldihydropteridine diphosphokinase [Gammaproteobacteria bacterium]
MNAVAQPVSVFLSAGSNIDPVRHLRQAIAALDERYGPLQLSPVYRSAPVGSAGEDFLNLVIGFRTSETPDQVVAVLEDLHRQAGRERAVDGTASHTLDLDLLLHGDTVRDDEIRLPRPDILKFAFVLAPLTDLAPDLRHPVTGQSMQELWNAFDRDSQPLAREPVQLR